MIRLMFKCAECGHIFQCSVRSHFDICGACKELPYNPLVALDPAIFMEHEPIVVTVWYNPERLK